MYSVVVRDHVMIAHSLRGAVFGPAQRLHGATYVIDAEARARELDPDGIVVDIGRFTAALAEALEPLRYQNLDDVAELAGMNTTTERLAGEIHRRVAARLVALASAQEIAKLPDGLKITLHESHVALAAYEADLSG
jgi:6-pyruvoyltetrahydropterin/6-carboxytetrahydropterin synthase